MPSSPNYKRDYAQEVATAKARGEQPDNAKRKAARRVMVKKGLVKPGQDVDHKNPLSKGGSNAEGNLRAVTPGTNRSFARTSSGAMKK